MKESLFKVGRTKGSCFWALMAAIMLAALVAEMPGPARADTQNKAEDAADWKEVLQNIADDPDMGPAEKAEAYQKLVEDYCGYNARKECLPLLERAMELVDDKDLKERLHLRKTDVLMRSERTNEALAELINYVERYPDSGSIIEAFNRMNAVLNSPFAESKPDPELIKRTGELQYEFFIENPDHAQADLVLLDIIEISSPADLPVSKLLKAKEAFQENHDSPYHPLLARQFLLLENLKRPYRSYGLTLLIMFAPVIIYFMAVKLLYNKKDPESSILNPQRSSVLKWTLTVLLLPLSIIVDVYFKATDVFMIHALGKPLNNVWSENMNLHAFVMIFWLVIPMVLLLYIGRTVSEDPTHPGAFPESGPLPRWAPKDPMSLSIFGWLAIFILFAGASYLLLDAPILGLALALPLFIPLLLIIMGLSMRLYRIRPLQHEQLRSFVTRTFEQFGLQAGEVWEAKFNPKYVELFLLPSTIGRPKSHIDPDLAKKYTANEFYTLVVHQIAHYKRGDRANLAALGFLAATIGVLLIMLFLNVPFFPLSLAAFSVMTVMVVLTIAVVLLEIQWDKKCDDFVLFNTGLYDDYLRAVLKSSGLDPAKVDLRQLNNTPGLDRTAKGRIRHILMQSAAYATATSPDPPETEGEEG